MSTSLTDSPNFDNTQRVLRLMSDTNVSMSMLETCAFLDLYEDEILKPMDEVFEAVLASGRFESAYSNGAEHFWSASAEAMREVLEDMHLLGEEPNEEEEQYAMHFGIPYRDLAPEEVEAVALAVRRFGGVAYCHGDNFAEWGEGRMSAEKANAMTVDPELRVHYQSGHLVVYINKGFDPEAVYHHIKEALPYVAFLPFGSRWAYKGLPFTVDEAEVWGENVNSAHRPGTHSSNWASRNKNRSIA